MTEVTAVGTWLACGIGTGILLGVICIGVTLFFRAASTLIR